MSGGELTHKFSSSFFLRRRGRRTCEHHYSPISDTSSWLHGLVLIELRACWRIVTEHSRSKAVVNFWWGLAQTKTFRRGRHISFRPIKLVVRGMKPATAHLCSVFFSGSLPGLCWIWAQPPIRRLDSWAWPPDVGVFQSQSTKFQPCT